MFIRRATQLDGVSAMIGCLRAELRHQPRREAGLREDDDVLRVELLGRVVCGAGQRVGELVDLR